jgi:hypothetical protein
MARANSSPGSVARCARASGTCHLSFSVDDSRRKWLAPRYCNLLPRIAPNLAESQNAQIHDMILSERPTAEIADVAGCNTYSHLQNRLRPLSPKKF